MRQDLHLTRALEVIEVVERLGDGRAAHDDAVVLVQQDALAPHELGEALALALVEDQSVELRVVRDLVVEAQAVLMTHVKLELLGAADGAGVGLVRVQHRHAPRRGWRGG